MVDTVQSQIIADMKQQANEQAVAQFAMQSTQSSMQAMQQLTTTAAEGERSRTNLAQKFSDGVGADAISLSKNSQETLSNAASA